MKKTVATQNNTRKFINLGNLRTFLSLIHERYATKNEVDMLKIRLDKLENKLSKIMTMSEK